MLEALFDPSGQETLLNLSVHVVRYKPERKCLLRYHMDWSRTAGSKISQHPSVVYGKLARRAKFSQTHDTLSRFAGLTTPFGWTLPRPLGVVPELGIEFFSRVPGVPLSELAEQAGFPELCHRVGLGLKEFHSLPIALDTEWGLPQKVARLSDNAEAFAALIPSAKKRIGSTRDEIVARLRALPPSPAHLAHCDFHADNVLVDGEKISLVDLEDCAMGDPDEDRGSMYAQLSSLAIRTPNREKAERLRRGRSAFLSGYLDGHLLTDESLNAHAALHLLLYAHQCLRHPDVAGRHDHAEAMLSLCEEVLEKGFAQ